MAWERGGFVGNGADNLLLSVISRRPAVRAAVDERAVATAFKAPDFPHRTCLAAGIFSSAELFLWLPDFSAGVQRPE
jgi:hypothetical protein